MKMMPVNRRKFILHRPKQAEDPRAGGDGSRARSHIFLDQFLMLKYYARKILELFVRYRAPAERSLSYITNKDMVIRWLLKNRCARVSKAIIQTFYNVCINRQVDAANFIYILKRLNSYSYVCYVFLSYHMIQIP